MPEETLVRFTDHARKQVFRNLWAKPLLQFIKDHLNKKLVYLGLPGILALDIKAWIEYLRVVIAFQCLDEKKEVDEAEKDFAILQDYLNDCEVSGKLENYNLYQGFLEQVIMAGTDDNRVSFNQNDYVTVYNLDFCNTLTSPYDVLYDNGDTGKCTKLDVVDKLLSVQQALPVALRSDKFLMYITVNANFLENDFDSINKKEYKNYKKTLNALRPISQKPRLIKAYAFYYLNAIFNKYGFQAEFLPTMYYAGSSAHRDPNTGEYIPTWMLTFTILGSLVQSGQPAYQQDLSQYLKCKFLFATDSSISCQRENKIVEEDFNPDPAVLIQESHTVATFWK